jgi:mono/diheme cytochrome c family protein
MQQVHLLVRQSTGTRRNATSCSGRFERKLLRYTLARDWGHSMGVRLIRDFVVFLALAGFVIGPSLGQDKQAKKAAPVPTSGAELYKQNCAVCHGNDGKGNGPPPADSPFKEAPPDLTKLAQRNKGKFPEAYVENVLRSGVKLPDHGAAEMPVWGTIFNAMTKSDEAQVKLRITNLTNYIKSIQGK